MIDITTGGILPFKTESKKAGNGINKSAETETSYPSQDKISKRQAGGTTLKATNTTADKVQNTPLHTAPDFHKELETAQRGKDLDTTLANNTDTTYFPSTSLLSATNSIQLTTEPQRPQDALPSTVPETAAAAVRSSEALNSSALDETRTKLQTKQGVSDNGRAPLIYNPATENTTAEQLTDYLSSFGSNNTNTFQNTDNGRAPLIYNPATENTTAEQLTDYLSSFGSNNTSTFQNTDNGRAPLIYNPATENTTAEQLTDYVSSFGPNNTSTFQNTDNGRAPLIYNPATENTTAEQLTDYLSSFGSNNTNTFQNTDIVEGTSQHSKVPSATIEELFAVKQEHSPTGTIARKPTDNLSASSMTVQSVEGTPVNANTPSVSAHVSNGTPIHAAGQNSQNAQTLVGPGIIIERGALAQVATAIQVSIANASNLEIRLDPPDLGRVNIDFTFEKDGGVVALLQSDNGDTSSLLRRHGEQLIKELANAGFEDVKLEFGSEFKNQSGDDKQAKEQFTQNQARTGGDATDSLLEENAALALPPGRPAHNTGPLDIRL